MDKQHQIPSQDQSQNPQPPAQPLKQEQEPQNQSQPIQEHKEAQPKIKSFVGLANQGATCYMNSILQALYMTPQFRRTIYRWKYDQTKHVDAPDCIPLQLQKLFANLQLAPAPVASTRGLIGSFGWTAVDSFEQHDVNQFWRVLFDAVQESMDISAGTEEKGIIQDFYEGLGIDYISCLGCNTTTSHQSKFRDIGLTIQNPFMPQQPSHGTVLEALCTYLKPEKLEGDNKYQCSKCDEKQDALKGFQLVKLPRILCFNLNRFSIDYNTMTRIKLNQRMVFPPILEMEKLLKRSSHREQLTPEELAELEAKNPLVGIKYKYKKGVEASAADKGEVDVGNEGQVIQNQNEKRFHEALQNELEYEGDSIATIAPDAKPKKTFLKRKTQAYGIPKKGKKTAAAKSGIRSKFKADLNPNFFANARPLPVDEVKGWSQDVALADSTQKIENQFKRDFTQEEQPQQEKKSEGKEGTKKEKEELIIDNEKAEQERKQKIKDIEDYISTQIANPELPPFSYEIFAIMVHAGTAHSGHYSAFIKDYETSHWYHFDDRSVRPISVLEISKVFGHLQKGRRYISGGGNAYMLMYRLIEKGEEREQNQIVGKEEIPDYVYKMVMEEHTVQEKVKHDVSIQQSKMQLKIFNTNPDTNEVQKSDFQVVYLFRHESYESLFKMAADVFEITEDKRNLCRLRKYNVPNDLYQDAYSGRESQSMEALVINPYNSLAFEWKKSEQDEFEEWNPNNMIVKLNFWREDIEYLSEDVLLPVRYKVTKDTKVKDFEAALSAEFKIPQGALIIMKRNALFHMASVEQINEAKNKEKTLSQVRVNEGVNLFLENAEQEYKSSTLQQFVTSELTTVSSTKWELEFELDRNRFTIKYNTPVQQNENEGVIVSKNDPSLQMGSAPEIKESDYCNKVKMDQRQTIGELRAKIASELKVDIQRVILKRGGSYGMELKEDDITLKNAHLFNLSSIYVELGKRSALNERRVLCYFAQLYHPPKSEERDFMVDNLFFQLQEIASLPLSLHLSVFEAKVMLSGFLKEKCGLEFTPEQLMMREKSSDKLTRVYADDAILEQYNFFQGKQIALQPITPEIKNWKFNDETSCLVMVRAWDPESWDLSVLKEIFIDKTMTLAQFGELLLQIFPEFTLDSLQVTKISSPWYFNRVQLPYEAWHGVLDAEQLLCSAPFYVSVDGLLFIIKDSRKKMEEPSEEERKKYGLEISRSGAVSKKNVAQEKGIKIIVKKKQEEPAPTPQSLPYSENPNSFQT